MAEIFLSAEFLKLALPLLGAVIAWFVNEWRKRVWEQYQRKETSYKELVGCLKGFYEGADDAKSLQRKFLDHLNQCWLYCPDEVIKKGYGFLEMVQTNRDFPDEAKEKAMGEFVAAVRRDLLSRKLVKHTELTGADFRHLGLTR